MLIKTALGKCSLYLCHLLWCLLLLSFKLQVTEQSHEWYECVLHSGSILVSVRLTPWNIANCPLPRIAHNIHIAPRLTAPRLLGPTGKMVLALRYKMIIVTCFIWLHFFCRFKQLKLLAPSLLNPKLFIFTFSWVYSLGCCQSVFFTHFIFPLWIFSSEKRCEFTSGASSAALGNLTSSWTNGANWSMLLSWWLCAICILLVLMVQT